MARRPGPGLTLKLAQGVAHALERRLLAAGHVLALGRRQPQRLLPGILGRWVAHLREPSVSWVRVPLGVLLVLGGLLGFLPVLGFWMAPLGLVLLALDVALLRRPTARLLVGGERLWGRLRRAWRAR